MFCWSITHTSPKSNIIILFVWHWPVSFANQQISQSNLHTRSSIISPFQPQKHDTLCDRDQYACVASIPQPIPTRHTITMASFKPPSQGHNTYSTQPITPGKEHRKRSARAYRIDLVSSSPKMTPQSKHTANTRRRRDSGACQRSRDSTKATVRTHHTPVEPSYKHTDQLGKTVSEYRLVQRWAGLNGQRRHRHRRASEAIRDQLEDDILASRNTGNEARFDGDVGLLERDWRAEDEEDTRPCYWRLLKKLNRELRTMRR